MPAQAGRRDAPRGKTFGGRAGLVAHGARRRVVASGRRLA
ncbi:hypothetical protein C7S17_6614 [Burkholderia thailandensis]|nr:hypothetical protein [Burkholderia thailandensis]